MKPLVNLMCILFHFFLLQAQSPITITVKAPENTDQVYITGNQKSLGDWDPSAVKMNKVSKTEFNIVLNLNLPAEFKFTRGSWESEGIIDSMEDTPNLVISDFGEGRFNYAVKGWMDSIFHKAFTNYYTIEPIESKHLDQQRRIKIYLPKGYSSTHTYPVFYLTDADYLPNFEIAIQYISQLVNFSVLPASIVVGIDQKSRNAELDIYFTDEGKRFKDFIFDELVPFVDNNYSTSGFNTIIGHSDGATFNHLLMTSENCPFRGFINISEALFETQAGDIADFMKDYHGSKNLYWYVANGDYDAEFRIDSGRSIDSIVRANSNHLIQHQQATYTADHNDLVAKSLLDGLQYVFKDYKHLNNPKFTDSLSNSGANPLVFWENYSAKIKNSYGIEFQMNDYDFYALTEMAVAQKDTVLYNQVQKKFSEFSFYNQLEGYSMMAQDYERMEFYSEALDLWQKNLEKLTFTPFYYQRPSYLLAFKLDRPKEAISFLQTALKNNPELRLYFHYYIAEISIKKKLSKSKAKSSLSYCEANYLANPRISKEDIKTLRENLDRW